MNETTSSNGVTAATLAFLAISSVSLYVYFRIQQMKKNVETPCFPDQGIPMAKGGNFLLGHLMLLDGDGDFREGYRYVYEEPADPATGLSSLWFVHTPTLSVLLGSHVKTILSTSSYRESIWLTDVHNDNFLGPKALTSLMGKEWKVYRSAVHKSFTPAALRQSQRFIVQVGNTLVDSLVKKIDASGKGVIERKVLPLMKMATIDVFGLAVLDADFDCCRQLQLSPVASAFEFLAEEYSRRLSTPWDPTTWMYQLPTNSNRMHKEKRSFIRRFIAQQIDVAKAKKDYPNANDELGNDNANKTNLLTNILAVAKDEAGSAGEISESAILDLVMTLLFGGYDTTSITLSYALYLMATHPHIEQECLKEINSVIPKGGEELQNPSQQLPYTNAVILETLRLYPPAPTTSRTLEKSIELGRPAGDKRVSEPDKIIVPEKTMVLIPIWSIQRDARNFPKPLEMLPSRWVKQRTISDAATSSSKSQWEERPANDDDDNTMDIPPANRDAFCVFAAGARNCVGRKLAMQEAVTIFAQLLQTLKFELVEDSYIALPKLCSVVQQPDGGLPMRITIR